MPAPSLSSSERGNSLRSNKGDKTSQASDSLSSRKRGHLQRNITGIETRPFNNSLSSSERGHSQINSTGHPETRATSTNISRRERGHSLLNSATSHNETRATHITSSQKRPRAHDTRTDSTVVPASVSASFWADHLPALIGNMKTFQDLLDFYYRNVKMLPRLQALPNYTGYRPVRGEQTY